VHDAPARLTPAPAALQGDHKSMEVILIRHTAVAVEPGTCYGHRDVPLTEPAEEAFERIAQRLPGVQAVAALRPPGGLAGGPRRPAAADR
jgi:hypothetical protein